MTAPNIPDKQEFCPACLSSSITNRPDHTHSEGCLYRDKEAYDRFMAKVTPAPSNIPDKELTILDKISAITGLAVTSDGTAKLASLFMQELVSAQQQLLSELMEQKATFLINEKDDYYVSAVPVSVLGQKRQQLGGGA